MSEVTIEQETETNAHANIAVEQEILARDHMEHHEETFFSKYVFSMDHKMISKQFLITGIFWAVIGASMSLIFRMQLAFPDSDFTWLEPIVGGWIQNGKMAPEFYYGMVTMHGIILVFFVLTAGLSGTFANLLIPFQIGARDMASPFMNMLSYWFFFAASIVIFSSLFVSTGPASGGWTLYPPLSALPVAMSGSGLGMTLLLVGVVLFIVSSLLGGLNYIATIVNMRTEGMSMLRMPLTIWAIFFTAIIGVLAFPALLAAGLLLMFDRMGTSFFLSDIYVTGLGSMDRFGGSPVMFQHLFWFLGHPEVYIIILPAMGLVSEIIANQARKPIFGYKAMILSILAIAILSFVVWAHHMFVTGMNPFVGAIFVFLTLLIAIPSAIKVFNWISTIFRGNIQFNPQMLFALAFVSTFISGGLTGIWLGNSAMDIPLHDTYFVV
ncbi:MAG TPA: cytochrome c oxidase subunit I, partial [Bacteroidetes bacterium]|nr:cytochrome c oxidase subunit I [Bacteroidota bacterium]